MIWKNTEKANTINFGKNNINNLASLEKSHINGAERRTSKKVKNCVEGLTAQNNARQTLVIILHYSCLTKFK